MKLSIFKRIVKEDFPSDEQSLVEKLAYPLNLLLDSFARAMANNISLTDNIACQVKEVTISVDANGVPTERLQFKTTLKTRSKGIFCLYAENTTSPGTPPPGAPFVTFTEENGIITIRYIKGLQSGSLYKLRLISFE